MNIGIRLHDTAGTNLAEHLAAAKAQGFTCVHIAMSKVIPGFKMADAPTLLTDELADEVRAQLEYHGVSNEEAKARIAALTDEEAAHFVSQIEDAPAGGIIGAILLVFFVLLITDILGFTRVFPFTQPVR